MMDEVRCASGPARGWSVGALLALALGSCDGAPPESLTRRPAEAPREAPPAVPQAARSESGRKLAVPSVAAAPPSALAAAPVAPVAAAAPVAPLAPAAYRHAVPGRLIAIGDLHGDLAAARAALRLGGAIDAKDAWIGGKLTVVQTGDQLDRGDDEPQIVDLFERLAREAAATGGQVIALNGNHETMNVQGDFRYVTPEGVTDFAGVTPRSPQAGAAPPAFSDRAAAFLPGGAYALKLAERDVMAVVGDSVFVHGGILPEHVQYGIDRINRETRAWMKSSDRRAPEVIASDRAPVWVRDYSVDPVSDATCVRLGEVLTALGVRRMVVGHTVQPAGISSACDDRVYRIDVGLSRYYGDHPIQVLEIADGAVKISSAPR